MPFTIVRNDIANMRSDAIVNTANPEPVIGYGTDSAIHAKAGPKLLKARLKIGRIWPGDVALTKAYGLDAKYVIHTVGPVWEGGGKQEEALLRSCYEKSLRLARKKRCKSIAFPLISTGTYSFPKNKALQIAIDVFRCFLQEEEMDIYLVVYDRQSYRLSESLLGQVTCYIEDNYVERLSKDYEVSRPAPILRQQPADAQEEETHAQKPTSPAPRHQEPPAAAQAPGCPARALPTCAQEMEICAQEPTPPDLWQKPCLPEDATFATKKEYETTAPKPRLQQASRAPERRGAPTKVMSLRDMLKQADAGFSETLLRLIDETGKKDSEIYKKANISKQHFSKIRNNPDYKPTKATALAFAVALELNMVRTRDLIGRAGYALSNSSKFDLIIRFFIERRNYDIFEINATLYEFDQPLLGV